MNVKALLVVSLFLLLTGCEGQGVVEKNPLIDIAQPVALQGDEEIVNVAAGMDSPSFLLAALINNYRADHGRKVMFWESELYHAAMAFTQAMIADPACLTTQTPSCESEASLEALAKEQGFTGFVDKNIRMTTQDKLNLQDTFAAWMASESHKRVLDNKRFNAVGIAIVQLGNVTIYTAVFGQAN